MVEVWQVLAVAVTVLVTKYDVSSHSFVQSQSIEDYTSWGGFAPDGSVYYGIDLSDGYTYQYPLSTNWDISTANNNI